MPRGQLLRVSLLIPACPCCPSQHCPVSPDAPVGVLDWRPRASLSANAAPPLSCLGAVAPTPGAAPPLNALMSAVILKGTCIPESGAD